MAMATFSEYSAAQVGQKYLAKKMSVKKCLAKQKF